MTDQHRLSDEERARQAFRSAIDELDVVDLVDPPAARRQVRRQRVATLLAAAVMILVAAVAVPQLLWPERVASWVSRPQPITEWRTEHYRDITFRVPAAWPYDNEPESDCFETSNPQGYVALERNRVVHLIGCDLDDDGRRLRSEHVHVQWLDKALPPTVGTEHKSGWWLSTRVFGESWIRVVSRDREFLDQVLSSVSRVDASTSGPCTPHHVLERNPRSRPEKPFDLTTMDQVDSVTLCQYEPQIGSNVGTSGLSRQAVVTGATAQELLQAMGQSQPVSSDACRPAEINGLDIVLVAHLHSGTTTRQLYVTGPGCAGDRFGRTDDGINVRTLSRAACDALLVPPIVPGNSMAATTKDCGW